MVRPPPSASDMTLRTFDKNAPVGSSGKWECIDAEVLYAMSVTIFLDWCGEIGNKTGGSSPRI